jgi:IS5 family transposase
MDFISRSAERWIFGNGADRATPATGAFHQFITRAIRHADCENARSMPAADGGQIHAKSSASNVTFLQSL